VVTGPEVALHACGLVLLCDPEWLSLAWYLVTLFATPVLIGIWASWMVHKWWTTGGSWDLVLWEVPFFISGILGLMVLALKRAWLWATLTIISALPFIWWTIWGFWGAVLWQVPYFTIGMLGLLVLVLCGAGSVLLTICLLILVPIMIAMLQVMGVVLLLIGVTLSHNQLGPIIKGATGIILLVGLFLDLLAS
jgi:hypothetical protein